MKLETTFMTRIDFYLLSSDQPQTRLAYACRLAHKAWQKGHRVYLHCASEQMCQELDALLWSFRRDAFVPHVILGEGPEEAVSCGNGEQPGSHADLLINLSEQTMKKLDNLINQNTVSGPRYAMSVQAQIDTEEF